MGFFSRNKEAVGTGRASTVPFETVRRSPRNSRKRSAAETRFDAGAAPLDPAETVKTRARRRLIGAVALALAAIVFVPMLFDRAPALPPDDLALQIPDRDTPFEGRRGVPDPARGPLKAAGDLPVVSPAPAAPESASPSSAGGEPAAPIVDKPSDVEAPRVGVREASPPRIDKPVETKTAEQAIERMTAKAVDKPKASAAAPAAPSDDARALAALEGRTDGVVTSSSGSLNTSSAAASTTSSAKGYAVQIAAYASPEKARSVRDQLVAGGLRSYVESVATPQGLRTRVRLGPFPSRDAADHARAKLKTMKLDGAVVPL